MSEPHLKESNSVLFKNATVYAQGVLRRADVGLCDGVIQAIGNLSETHYQNHFDLKGALLMPGMADVHVHLREPGFSYKETIASGSRAAAAGGYTLVCAMPNLSPSPDSMEHLSVELEQIKRDACIEVLPYGCITKGQKGEGELVDFASLLPFVCGFSDDGRGVQQEQTMRRAMEQVASLGGLIVAHCEVNALLNGGYIHKGKYALEHHHRGICSESEWQQVARDLELAKATGCAYHVCHISTRESVELVRRAKALGVDVTCETAPHYLLLTEDDLQEDGRFKMNPPLRSVADRDELIRGIQDGTIDMIATDHAPHSAEEKAKGLEGSAFGIVGLESAFALLYTHLVKRQVISMERLIELMVEAPRRRFRVPLTLQPGNLANLTIFELDTPYRIDRTTFLSMGKAQPFDGYTVCGRCLATFYNGKMVWKHVLLDNYLVK